MATKTIGLREAEERMIDAIKIAAETRKREHGTAEFWGASGALASALFTALDGFENAAAESAARVYLVRAGFSVTISSVSLAGVNAGVK